MTILRETFEMIFRSLYHFSIANDKGKAHDPIKYFAAPENQDLGVVKYLRKPVSKLDIIFGKGISTIGCLVDLAEETGVLIRKGAWYSYNGENISQGRDNAIKYMEEKPEFTEKIKQQVREKLEMGAVVSANSVRKTSEDEQEEEMDEEFEEE
ncbi:hypothetical protein NUACC21_07380 [Scytonema sp. NUACC21]